MEDKPLSIIRRTPVPATAPVIEPGKPNPLGRIEAHLAKSEKIQAGMLTELKKANKKVDSPWLTQPEAAEYLCYTSHHFGEIVPEHPELRHGGQDGRECRFNRHELDEWLDDPDRFKETSTPARRSGGDGKIHNLMTLFTS